MNSARVSSQPTPIPQSQGVGNYHHGAETAPNKPLSQLTTPEQTPGPVESQEQLANVVAPDIIVPERPETSTYREIGLNLDEYIIEGPQAARA